MVRPASVVGSTSFSCEPIDRIGPLDAFFGRVGVDRFEDLIVWQLAQELEQQIFDFTSKAPASRDPKFCEQIREAIRSAGRNTSEGFGRYYAKEFLRFLRYVAGSLHETKNQIHEARQRNYIDDARHQCLLGLCVRAIKANTGLMRYLSKCETPQPFVTEPRVAALNRAKLKSSKT